MKIKLYAKKNKLFVPDVIEYLRRNFEDVETFQESGGMLETEFPKDPDGEGQDILISYISPWIIPKNVLQKTRLWNINFHPGPPEYPGIGCFNWAIYDGAQEYGVTAHLMEERVDTGKIVAVRRFPLSGYESVYSLSMDSYYLMWCLFRKVFDFFLANKKLPDSNEVWKRRPFIRKELDELCRINLNMPEEEVSRRIKATTYPNMPGAYIELFDHKFEYINT